MLLIDKLIRSRRKTIGLQITNDARLIVRAPYFVSEDFIHQLIRRKEPWIKAKQNYFKKRQNKILARKFVPDEEFLFLGQNCPLMAIHDLSTRDHLERWYKARALEYITQRVEYYAQITGLRYQSIRINNAATRWGSCGHKNTLNFSWRLVMAPAKVVDYVIIHELTHLKQKNHSRQFWAEVAKMMPDYKQEERWLKENGHLLHWPKIE